MKLNKQFLITGDTHGSLMRFDELYGLKNWALIILGDAGFNYSFSNYEKQKKQLIHKSFPTCTIYCVRGNHEAHPKTLKYKLKYDKEIKGRVYQDPVAPNIKYLKDGEEYEINGLKTLVIGGAYSIDKYYRLAVGDKWFEDEQLSDIEKFHIWNKCKDTKYDLILSHTCPLSLQPTDLFLSDIDQSTVDNSMEIWMDSIKNFNNYNYWLWGHYHDDRDYLDNKHYMLYKKICKLNDIVKPKDSV